MAHGWLKQIGDSRLRVAGAGTQPNGVHPLVMEVMQEAGIELSHHTSSPLGEYLHENSDLVLAACHAASEACPVFWRAKRVNRRSLMDPDFAGLSEEKLKDISGSQGDEIGGYGRDLLDSKLDDPRIQLGSETSC